MNFELAFFYIKGRRIESNVFQFSVGQNLSDIVRIINKLKKIIGVIIVFSFLSWHKIITKI